MNQHPSTAAPHHRDARRGARDRGGAAADLTDDGGGEYDGIWRVTSKDVRNANENPQTSVQLMRPPLSPQEVIWHKAFRANYPLGCAGDGGVGGGVHPISTPSLPVAVA